MPWVSRNKEHVLETRLIIAYSLIALMAVLATIGGVAFRRSQSRKQRRDQGRGDY
jgi:hypothetical protein